MEDLKKLEDHKFDDLKAELENEIENLNKYIKILLYLLTVQMRD